MSNHSNVSGLSLTQRSNQLEGMQNRLSLTLPIRESAY